MLLFAFLMKYSIIALHVYRHEEPVWDANNSQLLWIFCEISMTCFENAI